MTVWFEDESFWEILYPFLFPGDRFEAAADEIGKVLELKGLFTEAGFSAIKVYGDLDGNQYGPGAERLIAVATR